MSLRTNQKRPKKYKTWFCEKSNTENASDSNALSFIAGHNVFGSGSLIFIKKWESEKVR